MTVACDRAGVFALGLLALTTGWSCGATPQSEEGKPVLLMEVKSEEGSPHRIVRAAVDLAQLGKDKGLSAPNAAGLRVVVEDGPHPGQMLPFRWEHRYNPTDHSYATAGDVVFTVPDASATRFSVVLAKDRASNTSVPLIGDGDMLRLAGDGHSAFSVPACYPCVVDFDRDGRRDLLGSDRYGSGSRVVWFRNVGTDAAPAFSEREIYPVQTSDGKDITNPNRGWMLTVAYCDWDGDGRRDLLVGGWCRYLTFYKNVGSDDRPVFAPGKVIFDAKSLPGLDYGKNPDTIYQGVFIEACDWDGDGQMDLLCGTYQRGHIYFLRNTGRDAEGLPILGAPTPLSAGGKEIDFLAHGQPATGDWFGHGKLDVVSGQYFTGEAPAKSGVAGIYLFENTGGRTHPELAAGKQMHDVAGRLIAEGFHTEARMVDWDMDGKQDLLVSGVWGSQLYLNKGTPQEPRLTPTPIPFEGKAPCTVNSFAYPVAADLDRDGRLDLIVGNGLGYLEFFKGLDNLEFAPPVHLKSQGQEIHETGCPDGGESECGYTKVTVADWNGDGYPDLIVWSNNGYQGWQRGTLGPDNWCLKFYPGTSDPLNFEAPVEITAAGKHIPAGYRCKPEVADLDGDGLLDLVVACGHGQVSEECTVLFFKNIGSKTEWKLAAPVPLMLENGKPLTVPIRTACRLVDWDGDGKLDLFTANHASFGVRLWRNVGTSTQPVFAAVQPMKRVNDIVNSHHEGGVDVVDLDGDGTLDLLVGSGDNGRIHFFRGAFLTDGGRAKGK